LPSFVIDFENDFDIVTKIVLRNMKNDGATIASSMRGDLILTAGGTGGTSRIDVQRLRLYYKLLIYKKLRCRSSRLRETRRGNSGVGLD